MTKTETDIYCLLNPLGTFFRNECAHTRQTEETRIFNKKKDSWQMVHFHRSDSKITY